MSSNDSFRAALDRRDERFEGKLDGLVDRLEKRFDRIEAKVDLRLDAQDNEVQTLFAANRIDLGELRDLIGAQGRRVDAIEEMSKVQVSASAEGAARGAGEAAGVVAARVARVTAAEIGKGLFSNTLGKVVAGCVGFTAIVAAISVLPQAAHGISLIWAFLMSNNK